uniref:Uncharacterized protein n=1 Tax=Arundo donax TaxID=35708 RepID=A0A0A9H872_ARUDO
MQYSHLSSYFTNLAGRLAPLQLGCHGVTDPRLELEATAGGAVARWCQLTE